MTGKAGDRRLPLSSAPGSNEFAEHAPLLVPVVVLCQLSNRCFRRRITPLFGDSQQEELLLDIRSYRFMTGVTRERERAAAQYEYSPSPTASRASFVVNNGAAPDGSGDIRVVRGRDVPNSNVWL